jgi:hypothetical protein
MFNAKFKCDTVSGELEDFCFVAFDERRWQSEMSHWIEMAGVINSLCDGNLTGHSGIGDDDQWEKGLVWKQGRLFDNFVDDH